MVSQSPSPELILKAIEAHLSPTIHFKFLPRALDIIAHAALLASKLSAEITRILESDVLVTKHGGSSGLGSTRIETLEKKRSEAEEASAALWQLSVEIRLHHVAAVLGPDKKFSSKISSLIECYFPDQSNVIMYDGGVTTYEYKSSKLFIRSMPEALHLEYQSAVHRARIWYSDASNRSPEDVDERGTRHLNAKKENAARLAGETIESARRVVECLRRVEEVLAEEMEDEVVKKEIDPEMRESQSPSSDHLPRIPHLTFPHAKKRKSSAGVGLTPIAPTVQPRPVTQLASERTTSLMETEAILDLSMEDNQSDDEVTEVHHRNRDRESSEGKPMLPQKPKKRSRPSFPPREGPDFTKPLPRHTPHKKLRPFTTDDLKR